MFCIFSNYAVMERIKSKIVKTVYRNKLYDIIRDIWKELNLKLPKQCTETSCILVKNKLHIIGGYIKVKKTTVIEKTGIKIR